MSAPWRVLLIVALLLGLVGYAEAVEPPYCTDGCKTWRPCDKSCRLSNGDYTTCGEFGVCEGGGSGGGGGTGGGTGGPTCSDQGWWNAEQSAECQAACGGVACIKKQLCGGVTCQPYPYYCWKCGSGTPPPPSATMYTYSDVRFSGSDYVQSYASARSNYTTKSLKVKGTWKKAGVVSTSVQSGCLIGWVERYLDRHRDMIMGDTEIDWEFYYCIDELVGRRRHAITLGISNSCWQFSGYSPEVHECAFDTLREGCTASCIPPPGVVRHPVENAEGCPYIMGYVIPFFRESGIKVCAPSGWHTHSSPCVCGDISNFP
jgi:hypothetical protein